MKVTYRKETSAKLKSMFAKANDRRESGWRAEHFMSEDEEVISKMLFDWQEHALTMWGDYDEGTFCLTVYVQRPGGQRKRMFLTFQKNQNDGICAIELFHF